VVSIFFFWNIHIISSLESPKLGHNHLFHFGVNGKLQPKTANTGNYENKTSASQDVWKSGQTTRRPSARPPEDQRRLESRRGHRLAQTKAAGRLAEIIQNLMKEYQKQMAKWKPAPTGEDRWRMAYPFPPRANPSEEATIPKARGHQSERRSRVKPSRNHSTVSAN